MIQRFRDAGADYPPTEYENVFTDARGQQRVIAWRTAPLVDANGDVVRIIAGGSTSPTASDARSSCSASGTSRAPSPTRSRASSSSPITRRSSSRTERTGPSATPSVEPRGARRLLVPGARRARRRVRGAHGDRGRGERRAPGRAGVPLAHARRARADRRVDGDADPRPVGRRAGAPLRRGRHRAQAPGGGDPRLAHPDRRRDGRREAAARAEPPRRRAAAARGPLALAAARRVELRVDAEQAGEILVAEPEPSWPRRSRSCASWPGAPPQRPHRPRPRAGARGAHAALADPGRGGRPGRALPPAIEAAAYYVAAEALANVAKYADATFAQVRVVEDERRAAIVVEVVDDGIGRGRPREGSGLRGPRGPRRVPGRRIRVESPPGGGGTAGATIPTGPRPASSAPVRKTAPEKQTPARARGVGMKTARRDVPSRGGALMTRGREQGSRCVHAPRLRHRYALRAPLVDSPREHAADRNGHLPVRRRGGIDAARPEPAACIRRDRRRPTPAREEIAANGGVEVDATGDELSRSSRRSIRPRRGPRRPGPDP